MLRSRAWAMIVTLLLLMGQAALSLASSPCSCGVAAIHDAASCCCRHAQGAPCPCAPHGGRADGVHGSCSHDRLAVTAHSMVVAPPQPATPLPALLVVPPSAIAAEAQVVLADWQGPPLRPQRLRALRTVVLRN
jgi:hypothetical protein